MLHLDHYTQPCLNSTIILKVSSIKAKKNYIFTSNYLMNKINLSDFPSTRYQGSKRKILPWIHSAIKELKFETALDAFGGSSSVSYLLKKMKKSVTYNDKLHFNYIIGKAIIENSNTILTRRKYQIY